jgi:hypothetical protein
VEEAEPQALERGTPLTADELMKVQGHNPPAAGGEDITPEQVEAHD